MLDFGICNDNGIVLYKRKQCRLVSMAIYLNLTNFVDDYIFREKKMSSDKS